MVRLKSTGLWAWSVSLFRRRRAQWTSRLAVAPTLPNTLTIARPRLDVYEHGGRLDAVGQQHATSGIGIGLAINSAEEFRSPYIRSALMRAQPISRMRGKGGEAGADGTNLWAGLAALGYEAVTRPSRFAVRDSMTAYDNLSARFQHGSLRNQAVVQIAPQRDDQLARQRRQGNSANAPFHVTDAGREPARQRTGRLMSEPQPGGLDGIRAFTNVHPANLSRFIEQEDCGPGVDVVCVPRGVLVIGNYRILDAQRRHFLAHGVDSSLGIKLGRVYADNRQAFVFVAFVPTLQIGQRVATVVAAKSPEIDEHDAPAQILKFEWCRVNPCSGREFRRRLRVRRFVVWNHLRRPAGEMPNAAVEHFDRSPAFRIAGGYDHG